MLYRTIMAFANRSIASTSLVGHVRNKVLLQFSRYEKYTKKCVVQRMRIKRMDETKKAQPYGSS